MKFFLSLSLISLLLISCLHQSDTGFYKVKPAGQTETADAGIEDDAADDPAIWYNHKDPSKSLILGSDKKKGLDVFTLNGKRLHNYPVGRINNVDVRQGMPWDSITIDIAGGSNRTHNGMNFWRINGDNLSLSSIGILPTQLPDVYGFCMYHSPNTGSFYAFVNSKTGKIEQWKLSNSGDSIRGNLVRTLQLKGQVEGMVADDSLATLFVGVEQEGVYRFGADENDNPEGKLLAATTVANKNLLHDLEGLALYYGPGDQGYLLLSSQGNNSYAVFERSGDNVYIGSFEVVDGICDGSQETDGIDVFSWPLGDTYPSGLFICQDGFNYEGDVKVAQNFKMVHWADIAKAFNPPLQGPMQQNSQLKNE